ncbi:MAG TPA: glycoside hydrolase family 97 protein [Puia sp.]|jgi:alpha-glucosidase|nr:glycoside hydrolase family 97 protein [Puia sp.]
MRKPLLFLACLFNMLITNAAPAPRDYLVHSPDGSLTVRISVDEHTRWSAEMDGQPVITPSAISLRLSDGVILGDNMKVVSAPVQTVDVNFDPVNYKKSHIRDHYNQLTLNVKGDYSVVFRVYDDAVAYRFVTRKQGELIVRDEGAEFNFAADDDAFIPIQWDYRAGKNFNSSFEALYHEIHLSQMPKDSLAFLPLLVDLGQNKKAVILEADLQDYPGMYLGANGNGLKGVYAPYPLDAALHSINYIPGTRADYIARTTGTRNFPWRVVVVSRQDKDLLNQDIVQKLAEPSQLKDIGWVRPGQVAWDWWNNWNVSHVDFKAGINTPTYKYYIDFAAANHIPYIIMDEGWSNDLDLMQQSSRIDLKEIIDYGKQHGVGVILWATWYAVTHQMEKAFPFYANMGVKGFKIDFIDRDDQVAIASTYAIARLAAANNLMIDYHGTSKPAGLQRTWPNVIGYEGVKGLENFKWANEDQPRYVATIPYIRMMAGPMDYTPGAMRNATQSAYRPINDNPMSKGTRCQQLAEYIVFEAPLQMLSDNPTTYRKEQECTDFITKVPTTFDETTALDGKVGEYVAIARRRGDTWFLGAITDWTPRQLTIDFSFLPAGHYEAEVFQDGVNADRDATDYRRQVISVKSGDKLSVQLYGGGGWVARIYPVK